MWTLASCFALAIASALFPWVNAELLLLAVAAPMQSTADVFAVVIAVTAGQVSGKSALFWIARGAARERPNGRLASAIGRWRDACEQRRRSAQTMMTLSAIFGVPPFYVTTVAAGAMKVGFGRFLVAAIVGRFVHFGAVALAPLVAHAWIG